MSIERHERLLEQMAALQMLAFKWMDAHDKLKAGKPYDLPTPADLPDTLTTMQDREATLIRALRLFKESAVLDEHTHRVSVDEFVLSAAREALGTSGLVER